MYNHNDDTVIKKRRLLIPPWSALLQEKTKHQKLHLIKRFKESNENEKKEKKKERWLKTTLN